MPKRTVEFTGAGEVGFREDSGCKQVVVDPKSELFWDRSAVWGIL
jgi:hypothetical protein